MDMVLREGMSWLTLLCVMSGVVVSALYLGRTRWAVAFMAGFGLQTLGSGFSHVLVLLSRQGMSGGVRPGFLVAQFLSLCGAVVLIGAVLGALSELGRQRATE